ncbi:MAG: DnaJ domain-containing protein [Dehalococcoidia bacterium]|nr:DnaJ domain-containing protein [Dehalococcoidia bacterium]
MSPDFDAYKILQVDPAADPEVIEAAYRRLAHKYHPDVNRDADAGQRMREINAAYAVLSDADERGAYDARRAAVTAAVAVEPGARAAAAPEQPAGRPAPWGIADILKAVGLVVAGTLAVAVPAALIADAVAGSGELEKDPAALSIVLSVSLGLELLLLFTALHFSVRKYRLPLRALGLRRPERGGWLFPIGLMITGFAIVFAYFGALALFGVKPDKDVPEEAFHHLVPASILGVLALGFAPLMEEVFFRGFVFGGLRGRWGMLPAALASGLLFGLAHLGNPGSLYLIIPIGLVGALFAWGYAYSGSILAPIAAHFLFNLASFGVGFATS